MRRPSARIAGGAIAERKYETRQDQLAYAAGYRDGWNDEVLEAVCEISPAYAQGVQDAREDRATARANAEAGY